MYCEKEDDKRKLSVRDLKYISSSLIERVLRDEVLMLTNRCNFLQTQNQELTDSLSNLNKEGNQKIQNVQHLKEEIDVLQKTVTSSCCHIAEEISQVKSEYEKEVTDLQTQISDMKTALNQSSGRGTNVIKFISKTFGRTTSDPRYEFEAPALLQTIQFEIKDIELHLKPLQEHLKKLKTKLDTYFNQLMQYRSCFNWIEKDQKKNIEETSLDKRVEEIAVDVKMSFEELTFEEIVQLCFVDKALLAKYISMMKTQLIVQKMANNELVSELNSVLNNLSEKNCETQGNNTEHSLITLLEDNEQLTFKPEEITNESNKCQEDDYSYDSSSLIDFTAHNLNINSDSLNNLLFKSISGQDLSSNTPSPEDFALDELEKIELRDGEAREQMMKSEENSSSEQSSPFNETLLENFLNTCEEIKEMHSKFSNVSNSITSMEVSIEKLGEISLKECEAIKIILSNVLKEQKIIVNEIKEMKQNQMTSMNENVVPDSCITEISDDM